MAPRTTEFVNLMMLGDTESGKTDLWHLLGASSGTGADGPNKGVDFRKRSIVVNQVERSVKVWDTAGQERFRSITASYYREGHGFILVFDPASEATFKSLEYWLQEVNLYAPQKSDKLMIMFHSQSSDSALISTETAQAFAASKEMTLLECKKEDVSQVARAVDLMAKTIVERLEALESHGTGPVRLGPGGPRKRSGCC
eukprot:m.484031 g.484031  ORF g.484031 m.484031 type:complete len:199 (-) comp23159_c0_seq1:44-640(-)